MKEELFKRIDALAVKLGVTAQYLWGVLVKQAGVEGMKNLALVGLFSLTALGLALWAKRCFNREALRKEGKSGAYAEDFVYTRDQRENYSIAGWVSTIAAMALTVPIVICLSEAITPLMNPEYWAFQQVMDLFK